MRLPLAPRFALVAGLTMFPCCAGGWGWGCDVCLLVGGWGCCCCGGLGIGEAETGFSSLRFRGGMFSTSGKVLPLLIWSIEFALARDGPLLALLPIRNASTIT